MNLTQELRDMKPGETKEFPAMAWTSIKASIIGRLRREFMAEQRDWEVGPQDRKTGKFKVKCITRPL